MKTVFFYHFGFRSDTCAIAAVFSGIELGMWFNYQFGLVNLKKPAYPRTLDLNDIYSLTVRTVVGLTIIGLTELIGKYVSYSFLCFVTNQDRKVLKASEKSVENVKKNFVELTSSFLTYSVLGFNTLVLVPTVFKYFNIQRESFFNEI